MGRASGGLNTPHWTRNNILDFQREMFVKIEVENGKIRSQTTIGWRMLRIDEVWIVDDTDSFRLEFVEKMERREKKMQADTKYIGNQMFKKASKYEMSK